MNFAAAAYLSATGLHIRREAWAADRWLIQWRGGWHLQTASENRLVEFADYTAEDLLAEDWTPMPAALAACPIDAETGSTGGSVPAPPGAPAGVPAVEDAGGVPLFSLYGALPGGPGKKTTYKPRPRPVTSCTFGTLALSAIPTLGGGLDVELTATGVSAGEYSVKFHVGSIVSSPGRIDGPNDSITDSISGLGDFIGLTLVVTATVTALGEGDCKGQQRQVRLVINPYLPPDVCAPSSVNLIVTLSGATDAGNPFYTGGLPNGVYTLVWDVGNSWWKMAAATHLGTYDPGGGPVDVDLQLAVGCSGGLYEVFSLNGVELVFPTPVNLGVGTSNTDTVYFTGGTATVTVAL